MPRDQQLFGPDGPLEDRYVGDGVGGRKKVRGRGAVSALPRLARRVAITKKLPGLVIRRSFLTGHHTHRRALSLHSPSNIGLTEPPVRCHTTQDTTGLIT